MVVTLFLILKTGTWNWTPYLLYNNKLSVNILYAIVNVDGWLLFKEAIRSQNRKDIHYEIEHATMS